MAAALEITDFLVQSDVVLDVRSPSEFQQGHIPGAINFPLFTDAERIEVGTCYKHQGNEAAVELGLAIVGPKLHHFVQSAKQLTPTRQIRLHCWRGGLRSRSMAWLLETAGFQVSLLNGGYKVFRRWVRSTVALPRPILIVGGVTGTGKTQVLHALAQIGEQVLDLEGLAQHRGSSFGHLGLPPQPSTEQYENLIACQWAIFNRKQPVWIEAESRQVGRCRIPGELFQQMERAPVFELSLSRRERLAILLKDYGKAPAKQLVEATQRIRKRLGGLRTQEAITRIEKGDLTPAIHIVLDYYDKTYRYDLERRKVNRIQVNCEGLTPATVAQKLQELQSQYSRCDDCSLAATN